MFKKVIFVWFLFAGTLIADQAPKPGTFYKYGQLGIKKTEIKGTKIHLTFKPIEEDFYWCPGIKVKVTKKATVVTFVRCKTSKNCAFDQKVAIGKKLIRTVTIDTKGQDTYVRNGAKQFKKIFSGPKKEESKTTAKTTNTKSKPAGVKSGSARTSSGSFSMRPETKTARRSTRPSTSMIINKFVPSAP